MVVVEGQAVDDGTVTRIAKKLHYVRDGGEFMPEFGFFDSKGGERVQIAMINPTGHDITVKGNVDASELKGDVSMYEVVFVMMLKNNASSWEVPIIKFNVKVADGSGIEPGTQDRTEKLVSKPRQKWMEILAGEFKKIPNTSSGTIHFSLDIESAGGQAVEESGLVIKSVIFRPVSTPLAPRAIQPFEINIRELSIYRGQLKDHWTWDVIQEGQVGSNTFYEVVQLEDIVWLEIIGKFDAKNLTDGDKYEVVFFLRLNNEALGWENNRVTTKVNNQNPTQQIIGRSYQTPDFKPLIVGEIKVDAQTRTDGIKFSLSETASGLSKKGLVIKNVLLRHKNRPT